MSTVSRAQRKKANAAADGAHPLVVLGAVVAIVLPAFIFLRARLLVPGDGAQLQFEPFRQAERGLLVNLTVARPGGLQNGDRVLALAGQPADEWVVIALRGTQPHPPAEGRLPYTVLRNGQILELNVPLGRQSFAELLRPNWTSYLFLAYMWAIGLIVFTLRPRQANAQATLLFSSILMGSGLIFFLLLQPSDLLRRWLLPLWIWGVLILYFIFAGGAIHFALLFPRRRAVLQRRPYLPWIGYLGFLLLYLTVVVVYWPEAPTTTAQLHLILNATGLLSATAFPLSILIVLNGYRQEFNQVERRQARWLLWSSLVAIVPWQVLSVIPELLGYQALIQQSLTSLLWLAIPTALAIAILREGLFDIDLIINRTLVYGALTGALVILYFAGVALLQGAFRAIAGQESPLAIVLSTLGIAALFNPLRGRIQSAIDRRFYRSKYNATRILSTFSGQIRNDVEVSRLSASLLEVADQVMQPTTLSLWLRDSGEPPKREPTIQSSHP